VPRLLGYFENLLEPAAPLRVGRKISYVDLSLSRSSTACVYAFPQAHEALREEGAASCRAGATASPSGRGSPPICNRSGRIPFNEWGVFRPTGARRLITALSRCDRAELTARASFLQAQQLSKSP